MCVCMYVCMYVYMHIIMYAQIYTCTHAYILILIHTHTQIKHAEEEARHVAEWARERERKVVDDLKEEMKEDGLLEVALAQVCVCMYVFMCVCMCIRGCR